MQNKIMIIFHGINCRTKLISTSHPSTLNASHLRWPIKFCLCWLTQIILSMGSANERRRYYTMLFTLAEHMYPEWFLIQHLGSALEASCDDHRHNTYLVLTAVAKTGTIAVCASFIQQGFIPAMLFFRKIKSLHVNFHSFLPNRNECDPVDNDLRDHFIKKLQ